MADNSYESLQEVVEHENTDYPVGVYYVEPDEMFMEHVRWHWHTENEFDLIKEGAAEFYIGDKTYRLEEGEAIFISRDLMHSIRAVGSKSCVIMSVIFSSDFVFPNHDSALANTYLRPVENDPSFRFRIFRPNERWERTVISYINEIIYTNLEKEFGYELQTQSLLCQLLLTFLSKVNAEQREVSRETVTKKSLTADEIRIKDAIVFIEQNYQDQVTLEDIASSIHVSKSECCRLFHRAVNMTPFEYLMHYRILKAADLIQKNLKDPIPISELATIVGFNNASYFNKRFREYFGCTPTQYRKMAKTDHRDKLGTFGLSLSHI
ncbi:MAG: AraC family transcriptional regulator [Lachnospiraceae bacterium]|nr:AraC family transcriptional regulator [Lachnospiraceae bacterium]